MDFDKTVQLIYWCTDWISSNIIFLTLLLLCYLGFSVAKQVHTSPLRHIPGPLPARLTKRYFELISALGGMATNGLKHSRRYGDIYVCQPNGISISDPADIRRVLSTPQFTKHRYYRLLKFTGIDSIMTTMEHDMVSKRRRTLGPYFTTSFVSKMEALIMAHGAQAIIAKWDSQLEESQTCVVNYSETFTLCMFSSVSRLVFGQELLFDNNEQLRWITNSTLFISMRAILQLLPHWLFKILTWPWEHMYTKIATHVENSISERKQLLAQSSDRPVDLLQALLDCEDPKSKMHLSPEQIHAEALLLLIGGIDPIAFTLTWAVHLLMLYPECYKRATDEVRSQFSSLVSYAEARARLPFLEACILETLRLVPVPSVQIPREVPSGGTTIKGHFIPAGTVVFANTWGSHTSEQHWRDPLRFHPERFLEGSSAEIRLRRHSVFTFGYGNRICLGKHLAWFNMLTILANLLLRYDFKLPSTCSRADRSGLPRLMAMTTFLSNKPKYPETDCQLIITKAKS
ncbi:hypothetical protein GGI25_000612 [Coemansia spiralis]|uniref:Cytochrome P450 n=2 Tax=Coemansia TaxID=4863 RepID=A0A9W8G7C9_9FUNG|nr:putative cytochrome P450 monooxygenase [Coemansia spiralis]KAJ1996069.1 hypothetical protein EDC05_000437 [Coemansia umbellata]KAJ2625512.1 hypothetical protein GGI26_000652 [Coemansia sp. RSA 1358]KAJ2680639.1 hypothetical protein GGI25_000612 [Coemansia spiralis]